jgi:hypothetical protein
MEDWAALTTAGVEEQSGTDQQLCSRPTEKDGRAQLHNKAKQATEQQNRAKQSTERMKNFVAISKQQFN